MSPYLQYEGELEEFYDYIFIDFDSCCSMVYLHGIIIPYIPNMCEQALHDIQVLNNTPDLELKEKTEIALRCIKFVLLVGMFAAPMTIMTGWWNP